MGVGALLDLVAPALCPSCRLADGPDLCPACYADLPRVPEPCARCAAPWIDRIAGPCTSCHGHGLAQLCAITAPYAYQSAMARLIGDAKAASRTAAITVLSGIAATALAPLVPPGATIVPLPPNTGRRDGPHLATALARAVAKAAGRPLHRWLKTRRPAAEQHRLAAGDRKRAVADLFMASPRLQGTIYLVDDILTSGATLLAAARVCKQAGATSVAAGCLARTPSHDDQRIPTSAEVGAIISK